MVYDGTPVRYDGTVPWYDGAVRGYSTIVRGTVQGEHRENLEQWNKDQQMLSEAYASFMKLF